MRRFTLIRETGGETGIVAWGVLWPDGRVAYRWNSPLPTSGTADSMEVVTRVHLSPGTRLLWLDTEEASRVWEVIATDLARQAVPVISGPGVSGPGAPGLERDLSAVGDNRAKPKPPVEEPANGRAAGKS